MKRLPDITVIPCCALPDRVPLLDGEARRQRRQAYGIPPDAFVVGYIGSFILWYMFPEMIRAVRVLMDLRPDAYFFIAVKNPDPALREMLNSLPAERYRLTSLAPQEAREAAGLLNAGLLFVRPGIGSVGASPTKLAELWMAGVPVLATPIGDIPALIAQTQGGILVSDFSEEGLRAAWQQFFRLYQQLDRRQLRQKAIALLSTDEAVRRYATIYASLLNPWPDKIAPSSSLPK